MTEPKSILLTNCPFCGGEAILRGAQAPEFWVACNGFGCKAQTEGFGSKEKAVEAWNRRALSANQPLNVDALAQEIRRVDGENSLGAGALAEALMPYLAALPEAPAGAVEVKALEWRFGARKCLRATVALGFYEIEPQGPTSFGLYVNYHAVKETFASIEAAKAAAQADYEFRIRSALLASPPAQTAAVDGECIRGVIEEGGHCGAACGWRSCTGCHETREGAETGDYPYSKEFGCYVGSGCCECGGIGVVWEYCSKDALDDMARDLDHAALASQAAGEVAVAWQRWLPDFGWQPVNEEDLEHYRAKGATIRPLYTHPSAADAGVREALREDVLKEAMNAAYSSPHYLGPDGVTPDADGLLQPGSPYDRGRYDARKAIAALLAKREPKG